MADETPTSEVTRSATFASGPEALWALVSDFGGLDKIMDGIDSCEVDGEGVGARRSIGMGGGVVVESLDALDNEAMTLTYSIVEGELPVKDYAATMTVAGADGGGSELSWTGRFTASGAPVASAEKLAGNIYTGGIAGFKAALGE